MQLVVGGDADVVVGERRQHRIHVGLRIAVGEAPVARPAGAAEADVHAEAGVLVVDRAEVFHVVAGHAQRPALVGALPGQAADDIQQAIVREIAATGPEPVGAPVARVGGGQVAQPVGVVAGRDIEFEGAVGGRIVADLSTSHVAFRPRRTLVDGERQGAGAEGAAAVERRLVDRADALRIDVAIPDQVGAGERLRNLAGMELEIAEVELDVGQVQRYAQSIIPVGELHVRAVGIVVVAGGQARADADAVVHFIGRAETAAQLAAVAGSIRLGMIALHAHAQVAADRQAVHGCRGRGGHGRRWLRCRCRRRSGGGGDAGNAQARLQLLLRLGDARLLLAQLAQLFDDLLALLGSQRLRHRRHGAHRQQAPGQGQAEPRTKFRAALLRCTEERLRLHERFLVSSAAVRARCGCGRSLPAPSSPGRKAGGRFFPAMDAWEECIAAVAVMLAVGR